MNHQENTRDNHNIKIANRSFVNLTKFKYLWRTHKLKLHARRN